ncbi:MAG TPA: hypothetical protein VHN11_11530 [Xanthobacteraceae bacterium]|jgi:hypothetical protein|nr:hypothetical protein [Xanthobacteraceae bacterium]
MKIAIAIVAALFAASGGFVIAGIYLMLGLAWAFIAAGVLLFGAATSLRMGLTYG